MGNTVHSGRSTRRFSFRKWLRSHFARTARMLCLIGVLAAAATALTVRALRNDAEEMLLGMGGELMRYYGADRQDVPRTLMLNGEVLKLSVGSTQHELGRVLSDLETECTQQQAGLLKHLKSAGLSRAAKPILREESDRRGVVACINMGKRKIGLDRFGKRLSLFAETGDLAEIGQLNYTYVERGKSQTTFVRIWTEGSFRPLAMFPKNGDAPGIDPPDVPRPPRATRLLSSFEVGQPQSLVLYQSVAKPEKLRASYKKLLEKKGWTALRIRPSEGTPPATAPQAHLLEKNKLMYMLVTGHGQKGGSFANLTQLSHGSADLRNAPES